MRMPINKKITFIVIAVALAVMAVVYFVFDPTTTRLFPKCAFYALTGFKCPGCGSQRAIHSLLHADVLAAIRYNALLVFSLPFIALLLTNRYWRGHFPRFYSRLNSTIVTVIAAIIVVLWWLLRNLLNL